jgi:hypothetical protein
MWRRERGKMKRLHNMQENPSCLVGSLPILFKTCSLLDCFVCVQRDYGVGIIKNRHCNKKMAMNSASLSGNLSSSSEAAAWAPAAIMSLQPRISIRPALLSLSPWPPSTESRIPCLKAKKVGVSYSTRQATVCCGESYVSNGLAKNHVDNEVSNVRFCPSLVLGLIT